MQDYIIAEDYTLPSLGKVYSKPVVPQIKLRSMTTEDEMRRLGHTEMPYKMLSEIIDDCLVKKPTISTYDMCLGDYQFLLHKLRIVTYGKDYLINTVCPVCGKTNETTIDLEALKVIEYSENIDKYLNITLPKTGKKLKLRLQTPRIMDEIKTKTQDFLNKSPDSKGEPAILFMLQAIIETVDGEALDYIKLDSFIRKLPMMDTNYILKSMQKIDMGIDTNIINRCKHCKSSYNTYIPIAGEFFGPSID